MKESEKRKRLHRYLRILNLVAQTDQLNQNQLWKRLDKENEFGSEPTIIYAIKDLEKWGMLRLVKTTKVVRGGKTFNYYELTRHGLENLIATGYKTRTITDTTIDILADKYKSRADMLPSILPLWKAFKQSGVLEKTASRRLAMFLAHFHGEQLEQYVRDPNLPPYYGQHGMKHFLRGSSMKFSEGPQYDCTPDDDVEVFLNPISPLYRLVESRQEVAEWVKAIQQNESLQRIFVRSVLRQAQKIMHENNAGLDLLPVEKVKLGDDSSKLYVELMAEVDILRRKIAG